jgi:hypothetical protein
VSWRSGLIVTAGSWGNLGEVLMEWAFEQLKNAGSTERLLKFRIRKKPL